jgi:hypothetical protein
MTPPAAATTLATRLRPRRDGMSTFRCLSALLADGEWHDRDEVAAFTHYPDEWLKELAHEGYLVVHRDDGTVAVRARDGRAELARAS